jgi:hypothetical protein
VNPTRKNLQCRDIAGCKETARNVADNSLLRILPMEKERQFIALVMITLQPKMEKMKQR